MNIQYISIKASILFFIVWSGAIARDVRKKKETRKGAAEERASDDVKVSQKRKKKLLMGNGWKGKHSQ